MIINFGKHQGTDIEDLPDSYLLWLAENLQDGLIQSEAEKEYNFRQDNNTIGNNP